MLPAGGEAFLTDAMEGQEQISAMRAEAIPRVLDANATRFTRHWNENEALINEMDCIAAIEHVNCTADVWGLLRSLLGRFKNHATELYRENEELKSKLSSKQTFKNATEGKESWASIALAAKDAFQQGGIARKQTDTPRRAKEIHITFGDGKDRDEASKLLATQIQQKLNGTGPSDVVAVRHLTSRDIAVHLSTVTAAKTKINDEAWAKVLGASAKIVRKTYPILVHGVRKDAYKQDEQKGGIEKLQRHNSILHPEMKIIKFHWPAWTERPRADGSSRTYTSIVVELSEPEMANKALREGFIENAEMKACEYYDRKGSVLQCFKCQKYGHMAHTCKNETKCGWCAGDHQTNEHEEKAMGVAKNCAVCGKAGHAAWESECPTRKKERANLQARALKRPVEFPVYTDAAGTERTIAPGKQRKRARPELDDYTPTSSQDSQSASSSVWRGPGRPRMFAPSIPEKTQRQIPDVFRILTPDTGVEDTAMENTPVST
jgi:hypothetical protein